MPLAVQAVNSRRLRKGALASRLANRESLHPPPELHGHLSDIGGAPNRRRAETKRRYPP
jgi:hypothetical protein